MRNAQNCKIDERVYWYADSQDTGVVFDLFGEVLGLVLQGQYRRTEVLSTDEKACYSTCYEFLLFFLCYI